MRIAIPTANGKLCPHFGHCEEFTLIDVDEGKKEINGEQKMLPPPHEPGVLPAWLAEQKVNIVIAGGMGQRAQQLFAQSGIKVLVGAEQKTANEIVKDYLDGVLKSGANLCDH